MSHEASGVNEGASIQQTAVEPAPVPELTPAVESQPEPATPEPSGQLVTPMSEAQAQASPVLTDAAAEAHTNHPGSPTNQAAAADGQMNIGAHGMQLPPNGTGRLNTERGGGFIASEMRPAPVVDVAVNAAALQARYVGSQLAAKAGSIINRAPDNIGLWGRGMTYHGTGILVNVDTQEKVRVYDGWVFEGDAVFANSRDLPAALVDGDLLANLAGTSPA